MFILVYALVSLTPMRCILVCFLFLHPCRAQYHFVTKCCTNCWILFWPLSFRLLSVYLFCLYFLLCYSCISDIWTYLNIYQLVEIWVEWQASNKRLLCFRESLTSFKFILL